jgi:hypothetical protein
VAWDRFLIAEPEGPSFISRTVAHAVWTGNARDTRPIGDIDRFEILQRGSRLCYFFPCETGALDAAVGSLNGFRSKVRSVWCDVAKADVTDSRVTAKPPCWTREARQLIGLPRSRGVLKPVWSRPMFAAQVLSAICDNELYVLTHSNMREAVEERFAAILRAIDKRSV